MKKILSLMVVGVVLTLSMGCDSKPTVTMPDTSAAPKRVESGPKTGVSNNKVEAPPPGR